MSGICGIVSKDREESCTDPNLASMVNGLRLSSSMQGETDCFKRGGFGVLIGQGDEGGLARQEMHGAVVSVAFCGKLYNVGELCTFGEIESRVAEVVLGQYLRVGIGCLERLRGEYGVAIWDGREETFYLATDRFRIEPLFYYHDARKLVFASCLQGILACSLPIDRTMDHKGIVDIMAFSAVCTPRTIFQEIHKVPPGHVLTYRRGEVATMPYWDINFFNESVAGEAALSRTLKEVFADAVSVRLQSERRAHRIGAFLSGGIDSSTVTGVLTQLTKSAVKSFSIGFQEERFNEIRYARIAARHFGSEHYEYFVKPADVVEVLPVLLDSFDEPFANASAIPTYYCAKLAKQHGVDVLYAGDGGDELFGGNERYSTQRLFDYYGRLPHWLRKGVVEPLVDGWDDRIGGRYAQSLKKYIRRANIPYPQRLTSYGLFNIIPPSELLTDGMLRSLPPGYDPYEPVGWHYFRAPAQTELDRQLYIDLKMAIADNDLFKVVRMTRAVGIAVRFPFLDHRLAEFAATIPGSVKMKGRELRTFFKNAYADVLPLATRTKTKHGFGLPIPVWLKTVTSLNDMLHDLVLSPRSVSRGYFRKEVLEKLVQRHAADEGSFYGTVLWNVMILELWHRRFMDRLPQSSA